MKIGELRQSVRQAHSMVVKSLICTNDTNKVINNVIDHLHTRNIKIDKTQAIKLIKECVKWKVKKSQE